MAGETCGLDPLQSGIAVNGWSGNRSGDVATLAGPATLVATGIAPPV